MICVLEDPQELEYDAFAKQAANQIKKIKANTAKTPVIMTESFHELLRKDLNVDMTLTEIEMMIYARLRNELQGLIVDEVRREVSHNLGVRGDDKIEQQVETLRQRLAEYYMTQLSSAPISPLLSDKDERLDKFYVPPKIVEKDPRRLVQQMKKILELA